MSIRIEIDGQAVVELEEENIVLGTDPACTIPLPAGNGLAPKHAVIRKIAGRWIVEVRGGDSIRVGDGEPTRMHWLNPGDLIHLTDAGPTVEFEPALRTSTKSIRRSSAEIPVQSKPVLRPKSDTIDTVPTTKPKPISLPPLDDAVELNEIKSKPATPKPKSVPSIKPVEFAEADVPAMRPLPALGKSSPWLGESASATETAQKERDRRRLWMQAGGASLLVIVVIIVWLASGQSTPRPNVPPVTNNSTESPPRDHDAVAESSPSETDEKPTPSMASANSPDESNSDASTAVKSTPQTGGAPTAVLPKSTGKGPSATLVAVRDGVYAVLAKSPDGESYYRLGTAWAASKKHLVTSGAVALAVEGLMREGASIVISQPFQDHPITIKTSRVHPAYSQAVERAAASKARLDDESNVSTKGPDGQDESPGTQLAKALANQARFDLGVLDIDTAQRLPMSLKMQTADMEDVSKTDYLLVGFPFADSKYQLDSLQKAGDAKELTSVKNSPIKNDSDLTLTMRFSGDAATDIWSGSPVFDRSQRVIGVYSRPATAAQGNEPPQKRRHAIIWLGRLREFAAELE